MRNISEININGKALRVILDAHSLWLMSGTGEGHADLSYADLSYADLSYVDLREADLCRANLREADLDYSCWPLSCKSNHVKVDARIAAQLAAHFCVLDCNNPAFIAARSAILEFARTSHRAADLGLSGAQK